MAKKTGRGFILGMVLTAAVLITPWAKASDFKQMIEVIQTTLPIYVEGKQVQLSKKPFTYKGTIYMPLRDVAESLGKEVHYDSKNKAVYIYSKGNEPDILTQTTEETQVQQPDAKNQKEFVLQGITIGDSEKKVLDTFGQPVRKDISEYGFEWYIYNKDYEKYIQIGIQNQKVVGLYCNSATWKSKQGIQIGTKNTDVARIFGKPITEIVKGNVRFLSDSDEGYEIYLVEDAYLTVFYDLHNHNTVTAIQMIEKNVEHSLLDFYGEFNDAVKSGFEKQVFDLANAVRVRNGLEPFVWDDQVASTARKHSKDMADKNYFAHDNLRKESPFDRMKKDGITYKVAAENIAAGQKSAIYAHEGWMNSLGHRKNILSTIKRLGVGIHFGGSMKTYYTQKFYTP